ncbi:putative protein OS=Tsukamurella paurometabola (strain ATCC 8368 / DSM / CCUG 35730 /CIP 100753 / JCM 10117 / KCTC 9821 / NBRC 16120 / NCIMB 702349/ NCTC 13040) OX=521096 GN=Tpau_1030 PE=4 SV=1 [Tsukamurella paurometabola]|uniref:Uncharacterized protein n=1 Tax=Tsukamurella paurometabola (strain ATCC 8368 / DSM 20162 / CCUG 35730 / CIP 100753 / JCM 10117 / KCTC 9821 / NBRC 16120 / NCIMB 702349 / NCTC 13040) TaxID=521096 RepID=D5UV73_TSUPD|nr:hypothetical protein [Tsukamurella paurometabola]ADG77663.1 conserved hypothetical protein [Tsukamurella paurometabola DSM 20162]SUP28189.1 Uncharacterised protein [Tsukamurella paurometabola]
MEPIGLNVGAWYLTELRPDAWSADEAYAWAVRVNTTGDSTGEVTLYPSGEISVDGPDSEGLRTARDAVARFGASL